MIDLTHCRIVLVRPQIAANLGATARAMRNFGLRDLVLVDPTANPADREARRLSTHGESILDAARCVPTLADAVADCILVAATSARIGGLYRDKSTSQPETVLSRVATSLASGPTALVFGPEPSGLTNDEVAQCQALIHIPTDPAYPALNLAQSVVICLYELRKAVVAAPQPAPPASYSAQLRAFDHLREGLEAIHFLYGDKADALMHSVQQLLSRAGPTEQECKLLHGLARQLLWVAIHHPRDGAERD